MDDDILEENRGTPILRSKQFRGMTQSVGFKNIPQVLRTMLTVANWWVSGPSIAEVEEYLDEATDKYPGNAIWIWDMARVEIAGKNADAVRLLGHDLSILTLVGDQKELVLTLISELLDQPGSIEEPTNKLCILRLNTNDGVKDCALQACIDHSLRAVVVRAVATGVKEQT